MTRASFLEELLGAIRAAVPAGPRLLFVEDALAVRGSHDACIGAERGPHCFSSSHQCVFAARLLLHYCTDLPPGVTQEGVGGSDIPSGALNDGW